MCALVWCEQASSRSALRRCSLVRAHTKDGFELRKSKLPVSLMQVPVSRQPAPVWLQWVSDKRA
jgi:hypothetical protein